MSTPVRVTAAFSTPFGEAHLRPCEAINTELEALFLARETDEHRNPTPSHQPQQETFESRFNLFRWPEAPIQQLRSFMLEAVVQTALQASDLRQEDLATLTLHNHTWFHITRYAGSFVAHNHALASWSAVYCVRAGEQPAEHPHSGALRFLDPRSGADAYLDATNRHMKPALALGALSVRLAPGQLVVFPSYLYHEVAPFYGRDTRITVAANCWFAPAA